MSAKEQILIAALRRMAEKGADGTSLREIADDVGIKTLSIMYHFASKDALRTAVLEEILARWNDVLPRLLLATTKDGIGRFEALTRELISFFTDDPNRARLLLREMMDRPKEMQSYLKAYVLPWVEVISDHVEAGRTSGVLNPHIDAEAFVWVLVNSVIGNIALADTLAKSALPKDATPQASRRLTDELIRMAKACLFHPKYLIDEPQEHPHGEFLQR